MAQQTSAVETGTRGADFASEVVRLLARLSDEGPVGASLSLPFGLSASMKGHGLSLEETIGAVLSLRRHCCPSPGWTPPASPCRFAYRTG